MNRPLILAALGLSIVGFSHVAAADKKYGPGVTDTEIKLGQTMPYSGPLSSLSRFGRVEAAYLRKINASGGINGRRVTLVSLDDAFAPAKTVEQTRKLVESDGVLAIVGSVGTPTNLAVAKYLNSKAVPQILVLSSTPKLDDPENLPWTTTFMIPQPVETRIYAEYLLKTKPELEGRGDLSERRSGEGQPSRLQGCSGIEGLGHGGRRGRLRHLGSNGQFTNRGTQGLRCRYVVSCLQRTLCRASHPQGA